MERGGSAAYLEENVADDSCWRGERMKRPPILIGVALGMAAASATGVLAHRNITRLQAPVDVVFIDADKEGYLDYLKKLLPLVRPGGLIIADNVGMAPEFVKAVSANPELETLCYGSGGDLGISLKKR
jgi:hypothetical protein